MSTAIQNRRHRDPVKLALVQAELGKLGHHMPELRDGGTKSEMLQSRADCRRAMDVVMAAHGKAERGSESRARLFEAAEVLTDSIEANSIMLDTIDAAAARGGTEVGDWRNTATGATMRVVGREHVANMAGALGGNERPEFSFADWLRGVAGMKSTSAVQAALSEGTDSAGGYSTPTVILPEFLKALVPVSSLLRAGARLMPLDNTAKTYRVARIATIPTAAWRAEAGAVAESDPAFSVMDLTPKSLAFFFKVSRELLADGVNIDSMLATVFAQALAKEIDRAGLRGTGTPPEPQGLLNISGIGAVTNGTNGATLSSIKWANLLTAYQTILDANGPAPTSAIMAPRSLVGYASLADTTGQPMQRPQLLAPLEFIATSQLPVNLTVGSSSDCTEQFVGDFTNFVIGMREAVSVLRADQLYAATGQVGFFCHARVDFGATYPAAFAKITGVRAG